MNSGTRRRIQNTSLFHSSKLVLSSSVNVVQQYTYVGHEETNEEERGEGGGEEEEFAGRLIWKIICGGGRGGGASFDGPRRRANERAKARAEKSNKQKMRAGPDRYPRLYIDSRGI